ncbi:MAG TPA: gephyrin-like molybdotransferase Glp [Gemmataceae bacterium]|nr:gephyrin-like molybdotransferase Glp [Gemmataceae bacterium]
MSDTVTAKSPPMLQVADAQAIVRQHARPLPPEPMAITSAALGNILAAEVLSDLDVPPYHKSMMDGYAVRYADLPNGKGMLRVIEEITAGQVPRQTIEAGQASRIMTGAPVPAGCDAVVIVERTRLREDGRVEIEDRPPQPGQNILPRGAEMQRGETILPAGTVLRPQEFGVLATIGRINVLVHPPPRVAILSTGDELVEPAEKPEGGQIRNSNGAMLVALVSRAGGSPRYLGIARDDPACLRPMVCDGLKANVLLLSGGVSAGKLDLVPGVLREAGVVAHFHKVEIKPGKPVFFGTAQRPGAGQPTLVFGLPGNPVSVLVCFELFVRPALRRLRGHADPGPRFVSAVLSQDFAYRTDRPTYHPAHLEWSAAGWRVRAVPWIGSADLRALTQANALVLFAPGDQRYRAGQVLETLSLD